MRKFNMICLRMGHGFEADLEEKEPYVPIYKDLPDCPKCGADAWPVTGFNWPHLVQELIKENHRLSLDIMDLQEVTESLTGVIESLTKGKFHE